MLSEAINYHISQKLTLLIITVIFKNTISAFNPITNIIKSKTSPITTITSPFTTTIHHRIRPHHFGKIYHARSRGERTDLTMVGDFFSGVTGTPPSSLDPPTAIILKDTNIDPERANVDLQCVYKASKDGWSAIDFHRCCDGRGSALVVALTKSGKKFGGFNPLGWSSSDDYGASNSAFLWFPKGGDKICKCPVLTGGNVAIFDYATGGPQFGSADLVIGKPQAAVMGGFAGPDMEDVSINAGDLKRGTSSVGGAYESTAAWPIRGTFTLVELEIYCNGNIVPDGKKSGGVFGFWPF